jgi:hypothetical protein
MRRHSLSPHSIGRKIVLRHLPAYAGFFLTSSSLVLQRRPLEDKTLASNFLHLFMLKSQKANNRDAGSDQHAGTIGQSKDYWVLVQLAAGSK